MDAADSAQVDGDGLQAVALGSAAAAKDALVGVVGVDDLRHAVRGPAPWCDDLRAPAVAARQLPPTIAPYSRVELLCLDEPVYLQLDKRGAKLLFQVLTEREEKTAVALASIGSFSG